MRRPAPNGRRFHALYDKIHRTDVLERAWELVAPTVARLASTSRPSLMSSNTGLLDELAVEVKEGRWHALAARRVFIPKPGWTGIGPSADTDVFADTRASHLGDLL